MTQTATRIATTLIALALLAIPAMAADLADVEVGSMSVGFTSAGQRLALDVTGPNDFHYAADLRDGGLVFEIFDADGNLLPDGTYNYELTALAKAQKAERGERGAQKSERRVQSGVFTVAGGTLVDPTTEEPAAREAPEKASVAVTQKLVHSSDVEVQGSLCVGVDCTSSESFGFDTVRLKENNLRIKFQDTSTGSFPSNDWQLTANDSSNGGANRFSIDDVTGGKTPFTIEAGAPSNSLYVADTGEIGIGTSAPVSNIEVHVKDGDTPTMRLEQDGSSGFTAQTWDVAGNEANFFIRDVNHSSHLPFRIKPGSGNDDAIVIAADGDVGMGTDAPAAPLEVKDSAGADATLLQLTNNSGTRIQFENTGTPTASTNDWVISAVNAGFRVSRVSSGATELELDNDGNLTVSGNITASTTGSSIPDYVFEEDYPLMPLSDLEAFIRDNKHLPRIPSAGAIGDAGDALNMTQMQLRLLEKVEELTLHTIAQQKQIEELEARLQHMDAE